MEEENYKSQNTRNERSIVSVLSSSFGLLSLLFSLFSLGLLFFLFFGGHKSIYPRLRGAVFSLSLSLQTKGTTRIFLFSVFHMLLRLSVRRQLKEDQLGLLILLLILKAAVGEHLFDV